MPTRPGLTCAALVRTGLASAAAILAGLTAAVPSRGDLAGRYDAGQRRAGQLQSEIQAEGGQIRGYEGTIANLQARLTQVQRSLDVQEQQLGEVSSQLTAAGTQLTALEARYDRGRRILAAQLVERYEAPPPSIIEVVVDAHGFEDLLSGVRNLRTIEQHNAQAIRDVDAARHAVSAKVAELTRVKARRQRATAAVLAERDQIAQLRLSIVNRELEATRSRASHLAALRTLRTRLAHQAAVLDAQAARAQALATGGVAPRPGVCVNTGFAAHGGTYGFFPAAGTNYGVGEEPVIAARLDALGRALQLHLIGISGYRTPEHSVEVGGFADDPHTQGIASDTPGVEGVGESTLLSYCLTRPFPGPREADHIQEG